MHPYSTLAYAQSLSHIGAPVEVPEWGTHVLCRKIMQKPKGSSNDAFPSGLWDAVGVYPISVLSSDSDLQAGLERLRSMGFVSLTMALDDFHKPSWQLIRFKNHFIHSGAQGSLTYSYKPHPEHRRKIRLAKRFVECSVISLKDHMDQWIALYDELVHRHILTGTHAFPRESFEALADIDGFEAIGGFHQGELVCCNIWAVYEGRAHSHLVASSKKGYELRASYAVTDFSIRRFADCDTINLGGSAGEGDNENGLSQYKRGFSNATAQAWLYTAILDPEVYAKLSEGKETTYFPAYRA